jgi:hypothetical protein
MQSQTIAPSPVTANRQLLERAVLGLVIGWGTRKKKMATHIRPALEPLLQDGSSQIVLRTLCEMEHDDKEISAHRLVLELSVNSTLDKAGGAEYIEGLQCAITGLTPERDWEETIVAYRQKVGEERTLRKIQDLASGLSSVGTKERAALFKEALSELSQIHSQAFESALDRINLDEWDGKQAIFGRLVIEDHVEFLNRAVPPVQWWIVDMIPKGGSVIACSGPPKSKKTMTVLELVNCLATGQSFLSHLSSGPAKVGYFISEGSIGGLHNRMSRMRQGLGISDAELKGQAFRIDQRTFADVMIDKPGGWDDLREFVRAKRIDVLVLDPLGNLADMQDENSNTEMLEKVIRPLIQFARELKITIILVHHFNKVGSGSGKSENSKAGYHQAESMRGASSLRGGTDGNLLLTFDEEKGWARLTGEMRDAKAPNIYMHFDEFSFLMRPLPANMEELHKSSKTGFLKAAGMIERWGFEVTLDEFAGIRQDPDDPKSTTPSSTAETWLKEAVEYGLLVRRKDPLGKHAYHYRAPGMPARGGDMALIPGETEDMPLPESPIGSNVRDLQTAPSIRSREAQATPDEGSTDPALGDQDGLFTA